MLPKQATRKDVLSAAEELVDGAELTFLHVRKNEGKTKVPNNRDYIEASARDKSPNHR